MGSQLRFDPSFFGLALRASAEADALLFSAHKDLSITRCPTRAGLRLTSTAKASGEWRSSHIKKPRVSCLASDDAERGHEEGHERCGIPLTPSPGNVFSCVTRVACGIFHPD